MGLKTSVLSDELGHNGFVDEGKRVNVILGDA
jgi:hypothetical protein